MSRIRQLLRRLHAIVWRDRAERDMEREMAAHLALMEEEFLRRGFSPDESRRQALLQFGSREAAKEGSRDQRGIPFLEATGRDFRHAVRSLRKAHLFVAVAVLSLTAAIGANVTVFSLIDAVLLRPLPVRDPQSLVVLSTQYKDGGHAAFNNSMFRELAERKELFADVIGDSGGGGRPVGLEYNGDQSLSYHYGVSGNFYSSLGIRPLLGRVLTAADDAPIGQSPAQVAVLGYLSWMNRFQGDPNIIGKTVHIEGAPFTIVGVTGKEFSSPDFGLTQHITTIEGALEYATGDQDPRTYLNWGPFQIVMGRLLPGVTIEQARAELAARWPTMLDATVGPTSANPVRYKAQQLSVQPGARGTDSFRSDFARPLFILTGIAGLILLIACINLANLSRVRAISRQHEMGIRVAIGAGRTALIRHMLAETILLSTLGSVGGLVVAHWAAPLLARFGWKGTTAIDVNLSLDLRIAAFVVAATFFATVMIGATAAWQAFRTDPAGVLQASRTASPKRAHSMRVLIVVQIAASLILVAGAGLFARTLANFRVADLGYRPDGLLTTISIPQGLGGSKAERKIDWGQYSEQLLSGVLAIPAVRSAAINIMEFPGPKQIVTPGTSNTSPANVNWITSSYFQTLGVPLRVGRVFDVHDGPASPRVAIINEALAQELGHDRVSVGQTITLGTAPGAPSVSVVGIVGDVVSVDDVRGHKGDPALVYLPVPQMGPAQQVFYLNVRTDMSPDVLKPAVERVIPSFGNHYALISRTGREQLDLDLRIERMFADLGTSLAFLALALVTVGLYGVTSYSVSTRTNEIGIRVALGATRGDVLRLFLGQTGLLVAVGLASGITGVVILGRFVTSFLTGVSARDPITLVGSVLILAVVGLAAAYIPTRRATAADPLASLRHE